LDLIAVTIGLAHAELMAVLAAVTGNEPRVMTVRGGEALPSGPFELGHRTLQSGLREWVQEQTGHPVGYLEQLYTFADRDRNNDILGGRTISISYLGLVREQQTLGAGRPSWHGWYEYLPWEDMRAGRPEILDDIVARLNAWGAGNQQDAIQRRRSVDFLFGLDHDWNEDFALQRYELLYQAGLVSEAGDASQVNFGRPMFADHRRILATGIARLRAKIKYRPVVFDVMPERFSMLQLQKTVEALAGLPLHKQNFRRMIEQQQLVEETGETSDDAPGRPAKIFRYRRVIVEERALSGSRLPVSRN
jgi:hypothetical protein